MNGPLALIATRPPVPEQRSAGNRIESKTDETAAGGSTCGQSGKDDDLGPWVPLPDGGLEFRGETW